MTNKKEMNLEEMEKINGGEVIELAGGFKPFISVPNFISVGGGKEKDNGGDQNSGGGTGYSNSNNGGKQMNNQGQNNINDNSGNMTW